MRRKNNGHVPKALHTSVLKPSHPDAVALGEALEVRFLELCKTYLAVKGEKLPIPSYLNSDMMLWRQMRVRHKKMDFRNTRDELLSTRRIAEWTNRVNAEIKNQKVNKIEWRD